MRFLMVWNDHIILWRCVWASVASHLNHKEKEYKSETPKSFQIQDFKKCIQLKQIHPHLKKNNFSNPFNCLFSFYF